MGYQLAMRPPVSSRAKLFRDLLSCALPCSEDQPQSTVTFCSVPSSLDVCDDRVYVSLALSANLVVFEEAFAGVRNVTVYGCCSEHLDAICVDSLQIPLAQLRIACCALSTRAFCFKHRLLGVHLPFLLRMGIVIVSRCWTRMLCYLTTS